jgi:gluconolactonase
MFAPPPDIKTEVFARVPDRFQVKNRKSHWVEVQRHGAPTSSFLEGPSFDKAGNLYVVDVPWGRIFKISPGGEFSLVAEYDGEPNGLKIHRDGRIFIADYRRGIMLLDPASGPSRPISIVRSWIVSKVSTIWCLPPMVICISPIRD